MNNPKIFKKAFTLAEVFIAMVILSVLVSVCVTFFSSKKDYEREFYYYSAYKNLVNVVDSALMNEKYLTPPAGSTARVEESECGLEVSPTKCRIFKSDSGTLCNVFSDYFNTTGTPNCNITSSTPQNGTNMAMKLTNGMEIYFQNQVATTVLSDSEALVTAPEENGYTIWIDLNGHGHGDDKLYYDVMPFHITLSGKVVPGVGYVNGKRGYDHDGLDAGGNKELLAFDIVQSVPDSNIQTVKARSLSFRAAACMSGYISASTSGYCKYSIDDIISQMTDCNNCEIRLVKKLRRTK